METDLILDYLKLELGIENPEIIEIKDDILRGGLRYKIKLKIDNKIDIIDIPLLDLMRFIYKTKN